MFNKYYCELEAHLQPTIEFSYALYIQVDLPQLFEYRFNIQQKIPSHLMQSSSQQLLWF